MNSWYVVAIGVSVIFLFTLTRTSDAFEEGACTVEDEVDTESQTEQERAFGDYSHYLRDVDTSNSHLLLVSTMDGKITALNADGNGEIVWSLDPDAAPLLSGTFSSHQKVRAGESPYTLIPSLDGSLFMLEIERSLLYPVPVTADISRIIDDVAVTGGALNSKTGIDPTTGEVKYRCTSGKCEQRVPTSTSSQTLIVTRNTQVARAADPLTGSEKWNLSVGEYSLQLFEVNGSLRTVIPPHLGNRLNFRLKPPDGVVSAYSCGKFRWENRLKSPLARVWEMVDGQIQDVSLFDSNNVEALSHFGKGCDEDGKMPYCETPFYFGFYKSDPYIISPDKARMQKLLPNFFSYASDLVHHGHLFLHDLVVVNHFKRKFRSSLKQIEMTTEAPKQITFLENCPIDEAILIPGSKEVELAETRNDDEIYGGWYVFTPVVYRQNLLLENSQPKSNIRGTSREEFVRKNGLVKKLKEKLKVTELVSGWWRFGAISLIFTFCSAAVFIILKLHRIRSNGEPKPNVIRKLNDFHNLNPLKMTLSSKSTSASSTPISGSTNVPTNSSSSSGTPQATPNSPFISKFLEDFIPEKCLGKGGYGVVFNCRHKLDDRNYAIKRVTVSNTPLAIEKVKREAKAMAKLDHPGIIRYFHTWIEKPPIGWQQSVDKQITKQIRAGASGSTVTSGDFSKQRWDLGSDASTNEKGDLIRPFTFVKPNSQIEKLLDGTLAEDHLNHSTSASISWALPEKSVEECESTSSVESERSFEENVGVGAVSTNSDSDSSSVVFKLQTDSCKKDISNEVQSSSSEPLKPPHVLVANETDLQTCTKAEDSIYLYIQMELCQELTLHKWLLKYKRKEDRTLSQMQNWLIQLVHAIDYIHAQGLIHRDIKINRDQVIYEFLILIGPDVSMHVLFQNQLVICYGNEDITFQPQNIFFSAGGHETLKIGDLGLATNFDVTEVTGKNVEVVSGNHHTGNVGTRLYMSPEQLKAQPYNEKVDVFSLGLIFAEMLIPFQTVMERHETLTALQKGLLPDIYLQDLPDEKSFILWLTTEDPTFRPTCQEVMQSAYLKDNAFLSDLRFRPDRSRTTSNNNHIPSTSKAKM